MTSRGWSRAGQVEHEPGRSEKRQFSTGAGKWSCISYGVPGKFTHSLWTALWNELHQCDHRAPLVPPSEGGPPGGRHVAVVGEPARGFLDRFAGRAGGVSELRAGPVVVEDHPRPGHARRLE